ncbi:MAG: preprotein translocase subunit SecF [Patescibacteria group bacterium]|jgi:preprotein translocase subunit SecF|nr:preprotein translocase subunit SecF [Patescibacteria group bacterium]
MFVIRNKSIFFIISGLLVLASIVFISMWGLRPSVDFTGGAIVEVSYASSTPSTEAISTALATAGFEDALVRTAGENGYNIRMRPLAEGDNATIVSTLSALGSGMQVERVSSVGPTVGQELRKKTTIAIILVVLMIILYIAFVFRKVAKPVSSWNYGLVAIVTLLHDIIIPTGVFAILGHFAGLEADTLFVVAILTILGLSVNDTIVVFDRIRENLRVNGEKNINQPFDQTVGKSLEQTYVRSFNTSFTVILVLLVLFFLGGPTIHSFVLTLLVGQIAGTYSSIFIASPLLVVIGNRKLKKA